MEPFDSSEWSTAGGRKGRDLFLDPDDSVEGAKDLPFDVERLDVEREDGEESDEDDAEETEIGPLDGSDRDY